MSLKAVLINREKLIEHGAWSMALQELLLKLYKYETAVIDISVKQMQTRSFKPEECLVIADCEETVRQAQEWGMAVLGYEPTNGQRMTESLPIIVEGFEEVDYDFLERVYQRHHHLPWTVIETRRCLLREITLDDLDRLYELYRPAEITFFMEGLKEKRKEEEEYTKAYIENMYRFYGYGMWVVIDKASGELIGRAGIDHLEVEDEVQPEMGYMIGVDYQRQGYATEVCQGVVEYIKEATEFTAVYCLIQKENNISIHLAEKLGFHWDKNVLCNGKEMQRYVKILQT